MKYLNYFPILIGGLLLLSCQNPASPTAARETSGEKKIPDWANSAILYECHERQFSPEGTFNGIRKQLTRLKDLGINTLWLMPIHPIGQEKRKGSIGSPYSAVDYYAVNPNYGSLDDLKALVQESHTLGLHVILDWVPNHTAWDAVWIKQHPEYYTKRDGHFTDPLNEKGEPTGWDDVVDLDYNNRSLRREMIAAMQYWVRTLDIDGFRVDMAGLVPNDFWAEVRPALDSIKPLFMLSEWQDEPGHFKSCFNVNYGWKWKDVTRNIAAGKQNALALDSLLHDLNGFYPEDYYQLYFTQNHDENSWSGTETELYGPSADAFNVLMFTWQGIPMLYNGQEDGLSKRLAFFEKDPVPWGNYAKTDFFRRLCQVKTENRALWAGKAGGALVKIPTNADEQVYAFTREKEGARVVVVLNLGKTAKTVTLSPSDEILGAYLDLFGARTIQVTKDMGLNLKPWEYLVLTNK